MKGWTWRGLVRQGQARRRGPANTVRDAFKHSRDPQKTPTKVRTTLRLSPQAQAYFKRLAAEENGHWQTLLDETLVRYVERQRKRRA